MQQQARILRASTALSLLMLPAATHKHAHMPLPCSCMPCMTATRLVHCMQVQEEMRGPPLQYTIPPAIPESQAVMHESVRESIPAMPAMPQRHSFPAFPRSSRESAFGGRSDSTTSRHAYLGQSVLDINTNCLMLLAACWRVAVRIGLARHAAFCGSRLMLEAVDSGVACLWCMQLP